MFKNQSKWFWNTISLINCRYWLQTDIAVIIDLFHNMNEPNKQRQSEQNTICWNERNHLFNSVRIRKNYFYSKLRMNLNNSQNLHLSQVLADPSVIVLKLSIMNLLEEDYLAWFCVLLGLSYWKKGVPELTRWERTNIWKAL